MSTNVSTMPGFGLALLVLLVMACGPSTLDRYSQQMNPLVQQHLDAYARLGTDSDRLRPQLLSATTPSEFIRIGAEARSGMKSVEDEILRIMNDWTLLEPPAEAQRFHGLVFEMMQLRYRALVNMGIYFDVIVRTGREDVRADRDADEQFSRSDQLWLDVLAEARKLGGVRLTLD